MAKTADSDLHLLSPKGFAAAGVAAGLKRSGKLDCGLLVATGDKPAAAAAAFTRNLVVAAPVVVGREHIAGGYLRAVAINSGNANACTGERGDKDARATCAHVARLIGCEAGEILPSSTGIIGRHLDMDKLLPGFDRAHSHLGTSADHAEQFAKSILTTDLVKKTAATTVKIGGEKVTIAGVTKGSGMIGPMMNVPGPGGAAVSVPKHATMLAYITTDAEASPAALRKLLAQATDRTFNRLTVDGHPSTNDTSVLLASGASGAKLNTPEATAAFLDALTEVCDSLSYQIAADGEGATKAVVVKVTGAKSEEQAAEIARAIADSPLVKTALHGNDPNWGRIVSMAGAAAAREHLAFNPHECVLKLCGKVVYRKGTPASFDAAAVSELLKEKKVFIDLDVASGEAAAHVYTCDLSRDYIRINADYHT